MDENGSWDNNESWKNKVSVIRKWININDSENNTSIWDQNVEVYKWEVAKLIEEKWLLELELSFEKLINEISWIDNPNDLIVFFYQKICLTEWIDDFFVYVIDHSREDTIDQQNEDLDYQVFISEFHTAYSWNPMENQKHISIQSNNTDFRKKIKEYQWLEWRQVTIENLVWDSICDIVLLFKAEDNISSTKEKIINKLSKKIETQLKRQIENMIDKIKILSHAYNHPFSWLPNRRYVDEKVPQLFQNAIKNWSELAIIAIDINFFKRINDTFGHDKWDETLIYISGIIKESLKEIYEETNWASKNSLWAHYWWDEYVIIFDQLNHQDVTKFTGMILKKIQWKIRYNWDIPEYVTWYAWISTKVQQYTNYKEMLKAANTLLERWKQNYPDQHKYVWKTFNHGSKLSDIEEKELLTLKNEKPVNYNKNRKITILQFLTKHIDDFINTPNDSIMLELIINLGFNENDIPFLKEIIESNPIELKWLKITDTDAFEYFEIKEH